MKKLSLGKLMAISCAAIFATLVLVLSPLYIYVNADIVLRETLITDLVYLLTQLFEIFAFAAAGSIIIHSAISNSRQKPWYLFGIYCTATLLRRALTLLISFISFGYLDGLEIFSTCVYALFDFAQMMIITTIVLSIVRVYANNTARKQKAAVRLGDSLNDDIDFSKIFSRANPYAKCSVAAAVVISATKIFTRAIFDVFAGSPEDWIDVASMAIGYLSDVLIFAVAYIVCHLITSRLYQSKI